MLRVYFFRLWVILPRHLRLRRTPNDSTIRDFHPYFYIQFFYNGILLNPDKGIVDERTPSTQVPDDLRDTLECFAARTANPYVVKPS